MIWTVRARLLLLLTGVFLLGWVLTTSTMLWDRDEPRFARAAVEMVQSGDLLVPHFDGQLRADKPPLVYWLMIPWIQWLGPSDLASRIPSLLSGLITVLATFLIGRSLGGSEVGLKSAMVQALLPLPLIIGTAATADSAMMAGVSLSLAVLVDHCSGGPRRWHLPLLLLSLTWAFMAKGPVGPLIFLIASGSVALLGKTHFSPGKSWWVTVMVSMGVATALFLAWAIPANEATGGELGRVGIGRHLFERTTTALESHGGGGWVGWLMGLPFYIPVLFLGSIPFSALLLPILVERKMLLPSEHVRTLLAALVLPTFLLMTLVATKLPHYILALFPGVSVMLVLAWSEVATGRTDSSLFTRWPGRIGRWVCALLVVLLGGAVIDVSRRYGGELEMWPSIAMVTCTGSVVWMVFRMRPEKAFFGPRGAGTALLVAAIFWISIFRILGEVQQRCQPAPIIASIVSADEGDVPLPFFVHGYNEPSLVFALNRESQERNQSVQKLSARSPQGLEAGVASGGPSWILIRTDLKVRDGIDLLAAGGDLRWSSGAEPILNYSTGREISLELWRMP